ncbi:MAG: glutathione S-transferase family protein [Arenicellales bacterium]
MIRLYALPLSAYCTKVRTVLRIKQVPFEECKPLGGHYSNDSYRQHMPPGSIPAIEEGEFKLFDSEAIVEYLEDAYPEVPMRDHDPQLCAWQRAVAQFHNAKLEPAVRALFPIVKVAPEKRKLYAIEDALAVFNDALRKLETVIEPNPFIGGTEPCLADCGFPATLRMGGDIFSHLGSEVIFSKKVSIWMAALETHSVIGDEVKKNRGAASEWVQQFQ